MFRLQFLLKILCLWIKLCLLHHIFLDKIIVVVDEEDLRRFEGWNSASVCGNDAWADREGRFWSCRGRRDRQNQAGQLCDAWKFDFINPPPLEDVSANRTGLGYFNVLNDLFSYCTARGHLLLLCRCRDGLKLCEQAYLIRLWFACFGLGRSCCRSFNVGLGFIGY